MDLIDLLEKKTKFTKELIYKKTINKETVAEVNKSSSRALLVIILVVFGVALLVSLSDFM